LGRTFAGVEATEIDNVIAFCLGHNIATAGLKSKVNIHIGNNFEQVPLIIANKNPRAIYVDPPWGGQSYKEKEKI
jgi:16S rRNA G966 N2-methylase RsmD